MGKAKDRSGEGRPVEPEDVTRVSDAMKDMPALPLHPLLAHPTAAFMAATAVGFGVASQLAGVMLGAFQSAVEAGHRAAREAEDERQVVPEAEADEPASQPAKLRAEPKAKVTKAKPETRKPAKAGASTKAGPKVETPTKASSKVGSSKPDDLKKIAGIGPKAEQVLIGQGVHRYADIAAWSKSEAARMDQVLGFGGRVERDDWVGQAKALVRGRA